MKKGLHPLLAAASLIVVVAGLRAAAPILNLFLLALLLTTSVAPVVLWQLRKGWSTNRAVLLTVLGVVLGGVLTVFLVGVSVARLARKLPAYESRLAEVHDSLASTLSARGVDLPDPRTLEALSPQKLVGYAASVLGALGSAFGDAILILCWSSSCSRRARSSVSSTIGPAAR
jgi:predicted PurR-regulated permease PerM